LVFLAGIVGVPWQDLMLTPSPARNARLELMNHAELTSTGRWQMILGSPGTAQSPPEPPSDRLMVESIDDRTLTFGSEPHPLIGAAGALAPARTSGQANVINGHETNTHDRTELQYACTFPLPTARDCTDDAVGCDCGPAAMVYNRSVCQATTRTRGRAVPGVRQLTLLRDFGELTGNAVAASICPKTLDETAEDYGYNPAMDALFRTMTPVLSQPP
jgi:hypothetical protein